MFCFSAQRPQILALAFNPQKSPFSSNFFFFFSSNCAVCLFFFFLVLCFQKMVSRIGVCWGIEFVSCFSRRTPLSRIRQSCQWTIFSSSWNRTQNNNDQNATTTTTFSKSRWTVQITSLFSFWWTSSMDVHFGSKGRTKDDGFICLQRKLFSCKYKEERKKKRGEVRKWKKKNIKTILPLTFSLFQNKKRFAKQETHTHLQRAVMKKELFLLVVQVVKIFILLLIILVGLVNRRRILRLCWRREEKTIWSFVFYFFFIIILLFYSSFLLSSFFILLFILFDFNSFVLILFLFPKKIGLMMKEPLKQL